MLSSAWFTKVEPFMTSSVIRIKTTKINPNKAGTINLILDIFAFGSLMQKLNNKRALTKIAALENPMRLKKLIYNPAKTA